MKQISVDFNTMMSEPVDIVKLGQVGTPNGDRLPSLQDGERVILYDEEMQVEAIVSFNATNRYWLASPDWCTRVDLPLDTAHPAISA
ncbi:MAG: hypothetical protein ACRDHP_09275 [Ktedonobacterales bacterium]